MLSFRIFWKSLRDNRSMLLLATILFAVGIAIGAIMHDTVANYLNSQIEQLRGVTQQLEQSQNVELSYFIFIFLNNAIKSVIIIYLGAFVGIIPTFFLIVNGMLIGYLIQSMALQGENIGELIVFGLLPHGIIEIPAILIASAYSLKFGQLILRSITTWNEAGIKKLQRERKEFLKSTVAGAFWIVIMLLAAAIIESTITYWLVRG